MDDKTGTRINHYIDTIIHDLNNLRNPTNPLFAEPKQDLYARIYRNLGVIKGLTQ